MPRGLLCAHIYIFLYNCFRRIFFLLHSVSSHTHSYWINLFDRYVIFSYADSHLHTCTYICRIIHNDTMIKTHAGRLLYKNMYRSLYCKGSKRVIKVCVWEGTGDRTETAIFWPHSYGRQRCVFLVLRCSTGGLGAHSAGWWLSLLHLISNFSGPQLNREPRAPSAWCGFPYHISSITPSDL